MITTYLKPRLYKQQSYYYKAYVRSDIKNSNTHMLFSYGTPMISMSSNVNVGDVLVRHFDDIKLLTPTTLRHIRDYLFQFSHFNIMTEDKCKNFKKDDIMKLPYIKANNAE